MISSTDPLGRTERHVYDLNGNLIRKIKRDGATIDFTHDAANQLIERRSTDDVRRYTYDPNGNLTSVLDTDSDVSFSYDPLDRVIRTTTQRPSPSALDYTYDPVGNRLSMHGFTGSLDHGFTTYAYDVMNRLVSLSNPASEIWNFSYDTAGRRTGLAHPNGILTSYSYDPASRLISLHHNGPSGPVAHFDYAYDPVGNRIQKGELEGSTGYGYDALNRLIGASTTIPGLPQEFYSYDAVGNRVTSYLSTLHVHDAANQLLEDQQFFYSYDPNGNQTGKTAKDGSERWVYTFDAENQLVKVEKFVPASGATPTMTATYQYDGLGRRISKNLSGFTGSLAPGLTTYVYDNEDILSFNGSKVTHGPGIDEPLKVSDVALLRDALGSVIAEVSPTGTGRLNYESFGTTLPPPTTLYAFTSREADAETGFYFLRRRYLDPTQGRFVAPDPLSERLHQIVQIGRINLDCQSSLKLREAVYRRLRSIYREGSYDYAHNNPLRFSDPFGLRPITDKPPPLVDLPVDRPGGTPGGPLPPPLPDIPLPPPRPDNLDALSCFLVCTTAGALCTPLGPGATFTVGATCFLFCQ